MQWTGTFAQFALDLERKINDYDQVAEDDERYDDKKKKDSLKQAILGCPDLISLSGATSGVTLTEPCTNPRSNTWKGCMTTALVSSRARRTRALPRSSRTITPSWICLQNLMRTGLPDANP